MLTATCNRFPVLKSRKSLKNKEHDLLKDAIAERITREMRFNKELMEEIVHYKKMDNPDLVNYFTKELKTDAFDSLDTSAIPLKIIFKDYTIEWDNFCRDFKSGKVHQRWFKNINNVSAMVERIYHRVKIIKIFGNLGLSKRKQSFRYLIFLISAHLYFEKEKISC